MSNIPNLAEQFHHAMTGVADFANQHHFGIRFREMIDEHGIVITSSDFTASQKPLPVVYKKMNFQILCVLCELPVDKNLDSPEHLC